MPLPLLGGLILAGLGKWGLDEYADYQTGQNTKKKQNLLNANIGTQWEQQGPLQQGEQRQMLGTGLLGGVNQQTQAIANLQAGGVSPQEIQSLLSPQLNQQAQQAQTFQARTKAESDLTKYFTDQGNKLRTERTKQLQSFNEARTAYNTTINALQNDSGAGSLAAVFSFMKALDPRSVVRENEQDAAQQTGGVADSLVGMVNKLRGKSSLGPEARKAIAEVMTSIMSGRLEDANRIAAQYDLIATEQNVPLSQIRSGATNLDPFAMPQIAKDKPPNPPGGAVITSTGEKITPEQARQLLEERKRKVPMRGTIQR